MKVLVTAGTTGVFIDQVRCLTNIFTGRTGATIALEALSRGHHVTLLTSNPQAVLEQKPETSHAESRWQIRRYDAFDDLRVQMEQEVKRGSFDAVIHSAAVSDYLAAGVFAPAPGTQFSELHTWRQSASTAPAMLDRAAAKVKSDESELWLRLVRAPKLVDMVRAQWGFRGILVKFKLEVGVSDKQLLEIAESSRRQSQADLIVANRLESAASWAYVGPGATGYFKIARDELPAKLWDAVEHVR
jgi:phosphopantothenoylcysteine synthetase/decarboxylase